MFLLSRKQTEEEQEGMITEKDSKNKYQLYPLKYVTELDKYVEEIYTEPVPVSDHTFELGKGKKST